MVRSENLRLQGSVCMLQKGYIFCTLVVGLAARTCWVLCSSAALLQQGQVPGLAARPANFFAFNIWENTRNLKLQPLEGAHPGISPVPCLHVSIPLCLGRPVVENYGVRYVVVRSFQSLFFEAAILEWVCQFVWYSCSCRGVGTASIARYRQYAKPSLLIHVFTHLPFPLQ